MHTYIWDLDRTYLQTDIRSVRGLVRSAFETAADKRTIPSADTLLRALIDHDPSAAVTVISGSPVQMREVLEAKLALDGIRVDRMVLKDNLRNIRRGRFRAVRGQLGYKLPSLLAHRLGQPPNSREWLFGDDAEVDALIYVLYGEILAGRVDEDEMVAVMRAGDAYDDQVDHAVRSLRRLPRPDRGGEVVEGVFIRVDEGVPLQAYRALPKDVCVVFDWFQAALRLVSVQRLAPDRAARVALESLRVHPWGAHALSGWCQDALRRRLVDEASIHEVLRSPLLHGLGPQVLRETERAIDVAGPLPPAPAPQPADWESFLRHRAAFRPESP